MNKELISGQKYRFILKPVSSEVIGLLPVEEKAIFLSLVYRKGQDYFRVQREDNSTYLILKSEIKEIKL